jgi:tRNA threonylcarbamoyladenosine biosynthesis protein TsaE
MQSFTVELPSRRATRQLGAALAAALAPSQLVILSGPLGAGKTFFVRGVLRKLGVPEREAVTSPTFSLVHEYETSPRVLHADLYRLKDARELDPLGLAEARASGAALLVEWGEPYAKVLGGDRLAIELALGSGTTRRAVLSADGALSAILLAKLARALGEARRETC